MLESLNTVKSRENSMLSPSGRVQSLAPRRHFCKDDYLFTYLFSVYVCACVCVRMHSRKECMCTQRPKEGTSVLCHYCSPPIPLSQGLSLNLEFKFLQVGWKPAGSSAPVSSLPAPCGAPGKGETDCLLCGFWDQSLGLF